MAQNADGIGFEIYTVQGYVEWISQGIVKPVEDDAFRNKVDGRSFAPRGVRIPSGPLVGTTIVHARPVEESLPGDPVTKGRLRGGFFASSTHVDVYKVTPALSEEVVKDLPRRDPNFKGIFPSEDGTAVVRYALAREPLSNIAPTGFTERQIRRLLETAAVINLSATIVDPRANFGLDPIL